MGEFIKVTNYRVTNNIAKMTGDYYITPSDIVLILGLRVTLDGKSTTLFDVRNNSGRICVIDEEGWNTLKEYFGPIEKPISTYTIINGVVRLNDTRYVDYKTINRVSSIRTSKGTYYECASPLNVVLYNTDGEGFTTITGFSVNRKKQIRGCDSLLKAITVDFDGYDVVDGLTYSLTFNDGGRAGCYTILGESFNDSIDVVKSVSLPLDCSNCRRVAP
jgi:hypothetical protein